MGDISVEPSMEDILSSIKRIIAEEGDSTPARRRSGRPIAARDGVDEEMERSEAAAAAFPVSSAGPATPSPAAAEILELDDPMPPSAPSAAAPRREPPAAVDTVPEPIVSQHAAAATRGSLDTLSRLLVKPEPTGDGTLEGLVREMLRPMLREWLDANLPPMVETMVAREIAKITGQPG